MNRLKRVTLREVAEAAGVSLATASYALNGHSVVAEQTRDRVLAAASDLGYRRSQGEARTGAAAKRVEAVLAPVVPGPSNPNYYVAELLLAVQREAAASGFEVDVSVWDEESPARGRRSTAGGVLYLGGLFPIDLRPRKGIEAVVVGTALPRSPLDAILADNREGAHLAANHLLELGRRRIGLINGPSWTLTSEEKWLGYRQALHEHGVEPDPSWVAAGDFTMESGYRSATELQQGPNPPDALFVADDPMAIGALQALGDLGLDVPRDVAVVGYGDSPAGTLVRPALSTVRVFQRRMGVIATRRLLERLRQETEERVRILVTPELVVRRSSAP